MEDSQFQHERLRLSENSIRLVQIHGGARTDLISLRITQYAISKRPAYAAISYTWGSALDLRKVKINGRAFQVHANLWHLLFHLRQRGESRFLWVDALCIDQANLAERNFHVQLMGKIYDQAEFAIVWLGLPADDRREARAMDFITEMALHRPSKTGATFRDMYLNEKCIPRWKNLVGFCRCRYWTRTWIIQEFLQARQIEVLCGTARLEWHLFDTVFIAIRDSPFIPAPLSTDLQGLLSSVPARLTSKRLSQHASTLQELIHEFYDAECTEPRDKVYGMLGIAGDCGEGPETGSFHGLQPDYSKHIVEVYFDVVAYLREAYQVSAIAPLTIFLLQESLMVNRDVIAQYLSRLDKASLALVLDQTTLLVQPGYINVIEDVIPAWSSTRDLKQKLDRFDWAKYVGYEMQRKLSRQSQNLGQSVIVRPTSSHRVRSPLPEDLISNAIEIAENAPETGKLYNYPVLPPQIRFLPHQPDPNDKGSTTNVGLPQRAFHIHPAMVNMHPEDKRTLDNPSYQKPSLIIEQSSSANPVRVGLACTNVRRGDLIMQFNGMDIALVGRRMSHASLSLQIIGKAIMVRHRDLQMATVSNGWSSGYNISTANASGSTISLEITMGTARKSVHPVCQGSALISPCLRSVDDGGEGFTTSRADELKEMVLETDPLSLFELLRRD